MSSNVLIVHILSYIADLPKDVVYYILSFFPPCLFTGCNSVITRSVGVLQLCKKHYQCNDCKHVYHYRVTSIYMGTILSECLSSKCIYANNPVKEIYNDNLRCCLLNNINTTGFEPINGLSYIEVADAFKYNF